MTTILQDGQYRSTQPLHEAITLVRVAGFCQPLAGVGYVSPRVWAVRDCEFEAPASFVGPERCVLHTVPLTAGGGTVPRLNSRALVAKYSAEKLSTFESVDRGNYFFRFQVSTWSGFSERSVSRFLRNY